MTVQPTEWSHDNLARDLARWLKSGAEHWVWLNAALGEWGGPRPDVMALRRFRYEQPVLRAYEAKISRSDLQADLRAEKWKTYLDHCQSVTFIMPSGLCKKEEIPPECGVMFRSGRGWRTERRPTDIGKSVSIVAMAKLLTLHPLRIADGSGDSQRRGWQQDEWRRNADRAFLKDIGERHGQKLADYLSLVTQGRDPLSSAKEKADKIVSDAQAQATAIRAELEPILTALGLPTDTTNWLLASAIKKRAKHLSADGQLRSMREALGTAEKAVRDALAVSLPLAGEDAA